jgi:hypothetical protein
VALIHAHNASAASRDMIENLLRHFEADPEPLQARGSRAAQIVQAPARHARPRVQSRFRLRPAVDAAETGEDELAKALHFAASLALARLAGRYSCEFTDGKTLGWAYNGTGLISFAKTRSNQSVHPGAIAEFWSAWILGFRPEFSPYAWATQAADEPRFLAYHRHSHSSTAATRLYRRSAEHL